MTNPTNQASGVAEPDDERALSVTEWIRNNYQDHPTIDSLCDALDDALRTPAQAPAIPDKPFGPLDDGWTLSISDGHSGYGVYATDDEYPEEGSHFLIAVPRPVQPASPAVEVAKWIDDPYDIEQGQMLNPEWLKHHGVTAQQVHQQAQTPFSPATPHPAVAVPGSLTEALERLVHDVRDLMENSEGVAGLHMNGDLAPWSDLKEGGRYSSWLGDALEQADAALATTSTAAQPESGVKP